MTDDEKQSTGAFLTGLLGVVLGAVLMVLGINGGKVWLETIGAVISLGSMVLATYLAN